MSPRTLFGMLEDVAQTFAWLKGFFFSEEGAEVCSQRETSRFCLTKYRMVVVDTRILSSGLQDVSHNSEQSSVRPRARENVKQNQHVCFINHICVYIFEKPWTGCSAHGTDKYLETEFWFSTIAIKIVSTTPWGAFVKVCLSQYIWTQTCCFCFVELTKKWFSSELWPLLKSFNSFFSISQKKNNCNVS